MKLHEFFQEKMLERGLVKKEIAKLSGISRTQIDDIWEGIIDPNDYQISRISKALGIDENDIEDAVECEHEEKKVIPNGKPVHNINWATFESGEKIDKPGLNKKPAKILNRKPRLHDIEKPDETRCRICNLPDDGTCYHHHCEVPYYKIKYGSGMAKKIDDRLVVWAHHTCGTELSIKPDKDAPEIEHSRYEVRWSRFIIEGKVLNL